uniref:Uncharacterized protein n=2 Tax=Acrobeloides nanus TaxID=290746 RepID=A0A914DMX5_9BILA
MTGIFGKALIFGRTFAHCSFKPSTYLQLMAARNFVIGPKTGSISYFGQSFLRFSSDLRTTIDWATEYLNKDRDLMKLVEDLSKKDKDLISALNDNKNLSVQNNNMEHQLKQANDELLDLKSMLSARGVIEHFERKVNNNLPTLIRNDRSRANRFEYIYKKNETFRVKIHKEFSNISAQGVGELAEEVFNNSSADIHSSNRQGGVCIRRRDYSKNQRKFLSAVCESIPCTMTVE